MRILLLQSTAPESLPDSLHLAALRAGHSCEVFDLQAEVRRAGRFLPAYRHNPLLRPLVWDAACRRLLAAFGEERFDLLLAVKGRELSPSALGELKRRTGGVLVNFYPDSPFYGPSTSRRLLRSLPLFDVFYVFGEFLVEPTRAAGAPDVRVLHFGWDAGVRRPVEVPGEGTGGVAFVGNYSAERQSWLEPLVSRGLEVWGDRRAGLWRGAVRNRWRGGPLDLAASAEVQRRAKIALNLVRNWSDMDALASEAREEGGFWGQGHNMRTFESPATGAFVLSTRTRELARMFREGVEIELFSSIPELLRKTDWYLSHDDERRAVATAGRKRIEHETYDARLRRIVSDAEQILRARGERNLD